MCGVVDGAVKKKGGRRIVGLQHKKPLKTGLENVDGVSYVSSR